ncbi:hypothetical protein H0266_14530 [Halobacillus locisalis]|uniref:Lipoprotein n=1 Tax=Halobacillus locisalis TaxID=220753 RepID=A0A838CVW9_9BACI|nr:hypothetical protein [Halobacillus locisalis]MBA2176110.1 hypothetical protein [Halobacillus locisalis]
MPKSKLLIVIAILAMTLIGCSPKGTFILGDITEINEETGDMKIGIFGRATVSDADSPTAPYPFANRPDSRTIQVENPENYDEGEKVQVKIIKDYDDDVWDQDRLEFEVKKID